MVKVKIGRVSGNINVFVLMTPNKMRSARVIGNKRVERRSGVKYHHGMQFHDSTINLCRHRHHQGRHHDRTRQER